MPASPGQRMDMDTNPKEEGEMKARCVGLGPSPEGGHECGIALQRTPNGASGIQPLSLRPGLVLSAFFLRAAIVEKWRGRSRQGAEYAREPCDFHGF